MKMLKVTNYVENVSRLSLEKLGLSTKRDNAETIGQFGSGIKFAPIAALRQGKRFVFAGNDSKGGYALEYVSREEDGIDCVFYNYGDYEKSSSFTVNAGSLSWENSFQIYREIVANAIDEAKLSGNDWDIKLVDVDDIVPIPGEFSVYISATDDIMEIHDNFDNYFSVNRESCYEGNGFKLYESIDDDFRVYSKGVLVFKGSDHFGENDKFSGLFDYEFDYIKLNEERTVASILTLQSQIAGALCSVNNVYLVKDTIQRLLFNDIGIIGDRFYEMELIPDYNYTWAGDEDNEAYKDAFEFLYPNNVIVHSEDYSVNLNAAVQTRGYETTVVRNKSLYTLLAKRGVKTVSEIIGEDFIHEYDMDISEYKDLNLALKMIYDVFGDSIQDIKNRIGVFAPEDRNILGITVRITEDSERIILISMDHALSGNIQGIIGTIMHEYDHLIHHVGDGDYEGRAFRSLADIKIGWLVYNSWWSTQIGVTPAMIEELKNTKEEM